MCFCVGGETRASHNLASLLWVKACTQGLTVGALGVHAQRMLMIDAHAHANGTRCRVCHPPAADCNRAPRMW